MEVYIKYKDTIVLCLSIILVRKIKIKVSECKIKNDQN